MSKQPQQMALTQMPIEQMIKAKELWEKAESLMSTPERATKEKFFLVNVVAANDQLKKCTPSSAFLALLTGLETGLTFNPQAGELYLIPRGDKATLTIGARGRLAMLIRDGIVKEIQRAEVVYEGETCRINDDGCVYHEINVPRKTTAIVMAYARFLMGNGEVRTCYMFKDDLDKRKAQSKGNLWAQWPTEMSIKCVIRKFCNMFPIPKAIMDIEQAEPEDVPYTVVEEVVEQAEPQTETETETEIPEID